LIERFTSHAREALAAAEREARALGHRAVATEHLLLGLLRVDESVAARALRLLDVTYEAALARSLVGASFSPSPTTPWGTPVSAEAPRLSQGRVKVRTEDLLLALIAHGEGVAAQVLGDFGVDLERAAVATSEIRSGR
jgi:ATP-dependent Clp protease ATP-binding subunit ClpC